MTSLNHNTHVSLLYYLVLWYICLLPTSLPMMGAPQGLLCTLSNLITLRNNALKTVNVQALGTP